MKSLPSASAVTDRWLSGMNTASQAYQRGIDAVQENPLEKAANAGQAYLEGCQRAEASGKRAAGLMRVSFQEWKEAAKNKGAARLASGATQAKNKYLQFQQNFLPFLENARQLVRAMPKGSFENNMARAYAMASKLHEYKRS